MHEQPATWGTYRFGDLVESFIDFRGRTPKKLGMEWGGEIPALSANNVRMGRIDLSREAHMGNEALYSRWMTSGDPQRGDVLLTMEAPLGNVAQVPDDRRYILSQRVILIKPKRQWVDADFLAHAMRGRSFQGRLKDHATGTTATGIQRARLVEIPIGVPPLPEQRKIAAILSSVDDTIEKTEAVIDQLEVVKKGLLGELMTRGMPGRHRHLKETEMGAIPTTWSLVALADVLHEERAFCYGVVQPGNDVPNGVPLIRVTDIEGGEIREERLKRISPEIDEQYARSRLEGGEVVVSLVGTIGRCAVAPEGARGMNIARAVAKIPLGSDADARFVALYLESPVAQKQLHAEARESARMTLNLEQLRQILLPLPSLPEQRDVAAVLMTAQKAITTNRSHLQSLNETKKALLDALLSGRVRSTVPAQEAA